MRSARRWETSALSRSPCVAQDGFPLDQPYLADTLVIAPGQRFDVLVHAVYPGARPFHCHILPHVEGPKGTYGMVTALVVR